MTAQAGDTFFLKRTQRLALRRLRAALPLPARRRAARQAAQHALRWLAARHCRTVAVYLSSGSELDTTPLLAALHRAGYRLCVPVIRDGARMHFVALRTGCKLRRKRHGIREPACARTRVRYRELDVVLMPLVGFDRDGRRLGAGGGYYDRFLARPHLLRRPLRVGYAYALQGVDHLPDDPWDIRLDAIITEQGTRQWPTG